MIPTRYDREVALAVTSVIVRRIHPIMAVELRCPECRAKLRLPVAPEPDSEIECPKCGQVFPCDENLVHAGAADDPLPAQKKPRNTDTQTQPEQKKEGKAPAEAAKPFKRKKRRAKKRKTKPAVIVGIVSVVVIVIGSVAGALIWFFTKKSASQEMITYLPNDCDEISGLNIGHLQKYPEFYKTCEQTFAGTGFKRAADLFAKVLGQETNDVLEYVVQGTGPSGEATVLRTKAEFDKELLSKFPGARPFTQDGVTYYTISDIPGLGYSSPRVFAPTNRLVVFCPGTIPQGKFAAMLNGNKDGETVLQRAAPLVKQTIRGTAWKLMLYPPEGRVQKLAPPAARQGEGGQQESEDDLFRKELADILSAAKGCGVKASVGSREVRGEFIVWYKDSEAAANMLKKWEEREWVKDEEKDPPRWWKSLANKTGGGKTAPNVLRDGLAFRSSGEVFIVRSSMETNLLKNGVSGLVGQFTGQQSGGFGTPPGGIPFPGGGGGPPGMPGGGSGPPGGRRRVIRYRVSPLQ